MANGQILELATLPDRHPTIGLYKLQTLGPQTICRLKDDPLPQPSGTMDREITIDWISQLPENNPDKVVRRIGWNGIFEKYPDFSVPTPLGDNREYITEAAAVLVMFLVIHELEKVTDLVVLQKGSGPDFETRIITEEKKIQVEVSGIRIDPNGSKSRARLKEKTEQVLRNTEEGYVSVTTFSFGKDQIVHSFLHYVQKEPKQKPSPKRRKKK